MIITFPRFGYTAEIMSLFFSEMGVRYIKPRENNDRVLKLGTEISPEEVCLPFKYMAGNLIEAYNAGADTAVMIATCGPCRLGEYGELLKTVLERAGYRYEWVIIDSPALTGAREFISRIEPLIGNNGKKHDAIKNIIKAVTLIQRIESAEDKLRELNGYTVDSKVCTLMLKELHNRIGSFKTLDEGIAYIREFGNSINKIEIDEMAEPVKILIAGEIYTSIESASNRMLEDKLMRSGCSVKRHMTVSWWIKNTIKRMLMPENIINARPHENFAYNIGGYGRETVKKIIKDRNSDGIIKIMPAGCMPEIVTKAYCEMLQNKKNIRILHLIYDEMSGEAGYETRVEAFTDMLERRKDVLAGDRHRLDKH